MPQKPMGIYNELRDLAMRLEPDMNKFSDKQNAAAGRRVRKGLQEIKKMAQELRKEIQLVTNDNK